MLNFWRIPLLAPNSDDKYDWYIWKWCLVMFIPPFYKLFLNCNLIFLLHALYKFIYSSVTEIQLEDQHDPPLPTSISADLLCSLHPLLRFSFHSRLINTNNGIIIHLHPQHDLLWICMATCCQTMSSGDLWCAAATLNMISIKLRRYPKICAETASGPVKATACSPLGILIGSS